MYKTSQLTCFLLIFLAVSTVVAHVPYFEHRDFSVEHPYVVWKNVEQSKAFYGWLETGTDVDVYRFMVCNKPIRIYAELIVPVVDDVYEDFVPGFALVGPGLPEINESLPFDVPDDLGGIVMKNIVPGSNRSTFYEPFGGKSYYTGSILDINVSEPGEYMIYCWDPNNSGGDYVFVLGKKEIFGPMDILRALFYTPQIRRNWELHLE